MTHEQTILQYSYWEHYKMAKDLSFIFPIDHPKRKQIEDELNKISDKLNKLKK